MPEAKGKGSTKATPKGKDKASEVKAVGKVYLPSSYHDHRPKGDEDVPYS